MSNLQEQLISRKRKLKPATTLITSTDGTQLIEKTVCGNRTIIKEIPNASTGFVIDIKPDLRISKIIDSLYIGSQDVAQDISLIKENEITHVLNVSTGIENFFEHSLTYFNVKSLDTPEFQLIDHFHDCISFIEEARKVNGNILVHCNAGISRSSTIVIAYIMYCYGNTYLEALEIVKSKRPHIKPNDGFSRQLKKFEDMLKLK